MCPIQMQLKVDISLQNKLDLNYKIFHLFLLRTLYASCFVLSIFILKYTIVLCCTHFMLCDFYGYSISKFLTRSTQLLGSKKLIRGLQKYFQATLHYCSFLLHFITIVPLFPIYSPSVLQMGVTLGPTPYNSCSLLNKK